jgi:hypothetical protein
MLIVAMIQIAQSLNNLAWIYFKESKYRDAETMYQQSLTIRLAKFGEQHPETARSKLEIDCGEIFTDSL